MAERGVEVVLVEKKRDGGRAATYCCKATDECNRCAACLVLQQKEKVLQSQYGIYQCHVNEISKNGDGYKATVVSGEKELSLNVQAVILATGFDPYDLSRRNEFAFGREQNVVTGLELEKAIKEKGSITAAYGENIKKIGFIQCVGSRDLSIDNGYCSRVCCMYAAKLAKIIKNELPDTEVDIFYMDFQSFGRAYSCFKETLLEKDKVKLVRGIPSKIYGFPYDRLTVRYTDSYTGKKEENMISSFYHRPLPHKGNEELVNQLNIGIDDYGFMASGESSVRTNQAGVFLAESARTKGYSTNYWSCQSSGRRGLSLYIQLGLCST